MIIVSGCSMDRSILFEHNSRTSRLASKKLILGHKDSRVQTKESTTKCSSHVCALNPRAWAVEPHRKRTHPRFIRQQKETGSTAQNGIISGNKTNTARMTPRSLWGRLKCHRWPCAQSLHPADYWLSHLTTHLRATAWTTSIYRRMNRVHLLVWTTKQ